MGQPKRELTQSDVDEASERLEILVDELQDVLALAQAARVIFFSDLYTDGHKLAALESLIMLWKYVSHPVMWKDLLSINKECWDSQERLK